MKGINFVNAPSPANQQDAHRWVLLSLSLFGVTLTIISIKQAEQLWQYSRAKSACYKAEQQCCRSNEYLNKYHSYAKQSHTISKKLNQILNIQDSLKRTASCIRGLTQDTNNSFLEACNIKERKAKVSLLIPQQENLQTITNNLSQTQWAQQVAIESIHMTDSNDALITVDISLKA